MLSRRNGLSVPTNPLSLRSERSIAADLVLWCGASGMVVCAALAVFLLVRVAGGTINSIPAGPALLLGTAGCAGVLATRRRIGFSGREGARASWLYLLPSGMLFLLCLAVTLPGIAWWAAVLLWLLFAAEEVWAWSSLHRLTSDRFHRGRRVAGTGGRFRLHVPEEPAGDAGQQTVRDPAQGDEDSADSDQTFQAPQAVAEPDEERLPDQVLLQLTRLRDENGESLAGRVRAEFGIGERTQSLHLPFCPPWHFRPEIEVHQAEGPPAAIKVALLEVYGLRLDIRLRERPDSATSVVLECFLSTK